MLQDPEPPSDRTGNRSPFLVGEWHIHADLNRLTREDQTVSVEPRVMEVLVCLAEHPGEVLTRETLLDRVWGDVVIQEEALTHAISRLRRAFGDTARDPLYIETIPKRGYRLIATVGELEKSPGDVAVDRSPAAPPLPTPRSTTGRWVSGMVIVAVVLALAGPSLYFAYLAKESETKGIHAILEGTPLTSYPGQEHTPALSPDGTRVAFSWDGGEEGNQDLYVKQLDAETPLRLTDTPGPEYAPRWSPDGSELLYLRDDPGGEVVSIVPATGGEPRPVLTRGRPGGVLGADWGPTGETLVVSVRASAEEPWRLERLSLETGELEPILEPPEASNGDVWPICSRTGDIAFLRRTLLGHKLLHHLPAGGGKPRPLIAGQLTIRGFDWTADGRALIFSSATAFAGEFRLWRVDVESGELTWLPTRGLRSIYPTVASETGKLVYVEETYRRSVVEARFDAPAGSEGAAAVFAPSSHNEYDAHYSPDGTRIAFVSTRSGAPEVYVADRDGGGVRQLTFFEGPNPEFLQWSEDGGRVAFEMMSGSRLAVHITDVERAVTRELTESRMDEILLSWALDGRSLYLRVLEAGKWRVERVDFETGETQVVFPFDAYMVAESSDGESFYFIEAGTTVVRRAAGDSEISEEVLAVDDGVMQCYWSVEPEGVLFYRSKDGGIELGLHEFESGASLPIFQLPRGNPGRLDLAPDRRSVLHDRVELVTKDLIQVRPFPGAGAR